MGPRQQRLKPHRPVTSAAPACRERSVLGSVSAAFRLQRGLSNRPSSPRSLTRPLNANRLCTVPHKFAKKNVDHGQARRSCAADANLGVRSCELCPLGKTMGRTHVKNSPPPTMIAPVFWAWAQEQAAPGEPLHVTRRRAIQCSCTRMPPLQRRCTVTHFLRLRVSNDGTIT